MTNLSKAVQPFSDAELEIWEETRDIEMELLESIGQMIRGETSVVYRSSQPAVRPTDTKSTDVNETQP